MGARLGPHAREHAAAGAGDASLRPTDPREGGQRRPHRGGRRGARSGGAGLWRPGPRNPAGTRHAPQWFDAAVAALCAARLRPLEPLDRGTPPDHPAPRRTDGAIGVSALLALFGFLLFAARGLVTYLHRGQQEEYDGAGFFAWLIDRRPWDGGRSLALAAIVGAQ